MNHIPETDQALVLRTDFSDDAAWKALCAAIQRPSGSYGFRANVDFVDDPAYAGLSLEAVLELIPQSSDRTFFFIVDRTALTHVEHPILVVDLFSQPGQTFRVIPSEMWSVENNLSIANMDFEDFTSAADKDGIHRGFPNTSRSHSCFPCKPEKG